MQEYSYTVRRRDKTAYMVVLAAFILAVILWAVSQIENVPFPAAFQLGCLFCLCVALWISYRYLLRDYTYRLTEREDGGFDFVVMERQGKRLICQCRVGTETFRSFLRWDKTAKTTYKAMSGRNWCAEIRPADDYLLCLVDGEEEVAIRFSPDATMAGMIRHALEKIH